MAAARWHTQTVLGGNDVPIEQRGDCVRACITSLLGLPIDAVENVQGNDWWQRWQKFVAGYGFELLIIYPKQMGAPPAGLWLAVVPSLALKANHCVIAKGAVLYHDPGMKRRYTADEWAALWEGDRVLEGWILVPLDPTDSFQAENAICGENGGGGNRTRVASHPEVAAEQEESRSGSDDDPPLAACNTSQRGVHAMIRTYRSVRRSLRQGRVRSLRIALEMGRVEYFPLDRKTGR